MKNLIFFMIVCLFTFNLQAEDSKYNRAVIQLLNKLTGKAKTINLMTSSTYLFDGKLYTTLRVCYKSSIQDEPENKAFIQIVKVVTKEDATFIKELKNTPMPKDILINLKTNEIKKFIFSGWLFSSSPSLSSLEDQVYDVTLLKCIN